MKVTTTTSDTIISMVTDACHASVSRIYRDWRLQNISREEFIENMKNLRSDYLDFVFMFLQWEFIDAEESDYLNTYIYNLTATY